MEVDFSQKGIERSNTQEETQGQLLEVKHLSIALRHFNRGLRASTRSVVTRFDVSVKYGEVVAVVGASGSGKSLLSDAILGLLPKNASISGDMYFDGKALTKKRQTALRGKQISLIPQLTNALDPLMKVKKQIQVRTKRKNRQELQQAIFKKLGLPLEVGERYPFELSGGMTRRILQSTAMIDKAQLIIADEPTSGLDVHIRNESIQHLKTLANRGTSIMLITHDIMSALKVANKIAIFYAGETVEIANVEDFVGNGERLRHPFTKALWRALPENDFIPLQGSQPLPEERSQGCVFAPRCPIASVDCFSERPDGSWVNDGFVRCFYA